jgi:copper chaperone
MTTLQLFVPNMTCQHCVRAISASVSDVPNVRSVHVDLASKSVYVTGTDDEAAVRAAVTEAGYEVA